MNTYRCYVVLSFLLLALGGALAQEFCTKIRFEFRVNSTSVDLSYDNNDVRLKELKSLLRDIRYDSTVNITKAAFRGAASLEGSSELNRRLARGRLACLEKIVCEELAISDSIVVRDDSYIPWDDFRDDIAESNVPCKEQVLEIIDKDCEYVEYRPGATIDSRIQELKKLDNGRVWRYLFNNYFKGMRCAYAEVITNKKPKPAPIVVPEPEPVLEPEPAPVVVDTVVVDTVPPVVEVPDEWVRRLHIKSNAIGWAFAIANIAVEVDIAKHWSATIPLYWSSWNYFTSTVKFRTLMLQPEVRYWFSPDNTGWFAGAHFGLAWYNYALDGKYRTQDHGGHSPAIGGGIAGGYRMPISNDKRWNVEFTLGAGVYHLNHDKFYNEPNGQLVRTEKKTYFGLDQAAVTFSYAFDLNKAKGGNR